jgi:hypothetical protein
MRTADYFYYTGEHLASLCDELSQYKNRDAIAGCETCSIGSSKYKNLKLRKEEERCCLKSCF